MKVTIGSQNLYKKNSVEEILDDLRAAYREAPVFAFQERTSRRARKAVRRFKRETGARVETYGSLGIVWDPEIFQVHGGEHRWKFHRAIRKFTPRRGILTRGLRHRATGETLLLICAHAINGYTRKGKRFPRLRDRLARHYFKRLRRAVRKFARKPKWDLVVLAGDLNGRPGNRRRDFYPGPILRGVVEHDEANAIDWITPAKASRARVLRRWREHANSDHPLHLSTVEV